MSENTRRPLARRRSFAARLADTASIKATPRDNEYEEVQENHRVQRRDRRELNRRHKRDPYSD